MSAGLHLIVGLGNPGAKYARTRHNVGFAAVEELARRHRIEWRGRQARADVAKGTINGVPVVLAKPQTYMNLSGESVSALLHWHKLPVDRLIILYDDMDLPLGSIRVRGRGSAGGHNGLTSIIGRLRTQEFARVRIGIERPPGVGEQVDWVLGHFTREEQREITPALTTAADAVEFWLTNGIEKTMNAFNGQPRSADRGVRSAEYGTTAPPPAPAPSPKPPLPGLGGQIAALRERIASKRGEGPGTKGSKQ